MFKVTERGIEDDGCIVLTNSDLLEIKDILDRSCIPLNGEKHDGKWSQQTAFAYDGEPLTNDEGNLT